MVLNNKVAGDIGTVSLRMRSKARKIQNTRYNLLWCVLLLFIGEGGEGGDGGRGQRCWILHV